VLNHEDAGVSLSVLDRLTDLNPGATKDPRVSSWEVVREFKAALCRDLAALLNTRRAEEDLDPAYEQCIDSVLTFGIVDFTSYNLKNAIEQERVRRSIERAIRQFEPRLARVTVIMDEPDPLQPALRFQIEAVLRIDSEPVLFDVSLHRDSRRIAVSGA
jgi:type VI secretion system protein ImpF